MNPMHTHILEPLDYSSKARRTLEKIGSISEGEDLQGLNKATILVVRLGTYIGADFLQQCQHLKYVLSATTGTDHVDLKELSKRNIQFICLKGETDFLGSIPSTAEHTWALFLGLMRNLVPATNHVNAGGWNRNLFRGNNIRGKRLGILGLGRVGKQVAAYAHAFGMQVLAFDTDPSQTANNVQTFSSYHSFAKQLDVLSIHIPLEPATESWLDNEKLQELPAGVIVINTSRGRVWDERALCQLVESGHIAGVATDVLFDEMTAEKREQSRLVQLANNPNYRVVVTPHIAGATFESMAMTEEFVVERFLAILKER